MLRISITLPAQGVLVSSVVRLFKIFDRANKYALENENLPPFEMHIVAGKAPVSLYGNSINLKPRLQFPDISYTDLIVIPALAGDMAAVLNLDEALKEWMIERHNAGTQIACLCTSVFLLSATGLLQMDNSKREWFVDANFRQQFTHIDLVAEKAVLNGTITTNGGAYSFIEGVIQEYAGREIANACNSMFQIEFNRECQSLAVLSGLYQNDEPGQTIDSYRQRDSKYTTTAVEFADMFCQQNSNINQSFYNYITCETGQMECMPDVFLPQTGVTSNNNRKTLRKMLSTLKNV